MSERKQPNRENPMGREYTAEEWRAARAAWPQYNKPTEIGRGPLIYATGAGHPDLVAKLIARTEKKLADLKIVQGAMAREWQKPVPPPHGGQS